MKITDIISEEGLGTKILSKTLGALKSSDKAVLGSVKDFTKQSGEQIASIAKSRGISIEQAADEVFKVPTAAQNRAVADLVAQGFTKEKAMQRLGLETHEYYDLAKYPNMKKDSISRAKEVLGKDALGKIGDVAKTTGTVVKATFAGADWLVYLTVQFAALAPPYMQFRKNMEGAAEYLDSGEWKQDQFDGYADRQVGILLAKWTAILAAGALIRLVTLKPLWKKMVASDVPGLREVGRVLSMGTSAAALTGMNWFNDPSNAEAFSKVMMSPFLSWLPDTVGGPIRQALNSFVGGFGLGAGGGTPHTSGPVANNTSTTGSANNTSTTGSADTTGQAQKPPTTTAADNGNITTAQMLGNRGDDEYKGWQEIPSDPRWIRNPADPMDIALKPANWKKP